jgi:hypothetical protein
MKTYWVSGDLAPHILNFGSRWGEWSASRSGCFIPGGRSWQGHPSQRGERVGARLSVVHWSFKFGGGRGANNSTPKNFLLRNATRGGQGSSRIEPRRREEGGRRRRKCPLSLISKLKGARWSELSVSRPGRFTYGGFPGTHWIGRWVSPEEKIWTRWRREKFLSCPCGEPKPCRSARSLVTTLTELPLPRSYNRSHAFQVS